MPSLFRRLDLRFENDVVQARQHARLIASLLSFDHQEQIRLATATSEIARNAFRYARGGRVEFLVKLEAPQEFIIKVEDNGPGISKLKEVLGGSYRSTTGMGKGISGTKRLMDRFFIESKPDGTHVEFGKQLAKNAPTLTLQKVQTLIKQISENQPENPFQEMERQNQDLLRTLAELRGRQEELAQLNGELEDTNRGVVALYAELDERADALRRISDAKTSFLSNMSHEFRTPLNSVLSLSRMLMERVDGDLTPEQEKQVKYIQMAAQDLADMVNDLLDLAKVEAGKIEIKPREFEVEDLFGALRGMLKPLLLDSSVNLVFDSDPELPKMHTDEGKVSQILRNFISNALKFTPNGEVRVTASAGKDGTVIFSVADTGIGIAPEDQRRIFREFEQVDNEIQGTVKGTGLGLALSRNLAQLLGGSVTLSSELGKGSTFSAILPAMFPGLSTTDLTPLAPPLAADRVPILLVEDNQETTFLLEKYLEKTEFQVISAPSLEQSRKLLLQFSPRVVVLDVLLRGESSWAFINEIKNALPGVPVLCISVTADIDTAALNGADAYLRKPVSRDALLGQLRLLTRRRLPKILLIDDDEVARYLLRGSIPEGQFEVLEARGGEEGVRLAQQESPAAVFLDLNMPDVDGFDVLRELRRTDRTRNIPAIIHSSRALSENEQTLLRLPSVFLFPKSSMQAAGARALVLGVLRQAGLKATGEGEATIG